MIAIFVSNIRDMQNAFQVALVASPLLLPSVSIVVTIAIAIGWFQEAVR